MLETLWQTHLAPLLESSQAKAEAERLEKWQACQLFLTPALAWQLSESLFVNWSQNEKEQTLKALAALIQNLNVHKTGPDSLRHPFWLDCYAFLLRLTPIRATDSAGSTFPQRKAHQTLPPDLWTEKPPKKPQVWPSDYALTTMMQELQSGTYLEQAETLLVGAPLAQLENEYRFWQGFFTPHASDDFALHALFHLAAAVLECYCRVELYQSHLFKPLLLPLLKVLWNDQPIHLSRLVPLLETPWQGYGDLQSRLMQLIQQGEDLSKVRQYRDQLFHTIHLGHEEHLSAVLSKLNHFLKDSRPPFSALDSLIRTPDQVPAYQILHPPQIQADGLQAQFPIQRLYLSEKNQPQSVESLGRRREQDQGIKRAHLQHSEAIQQFWRSPNLSVFQREGATELFESRWISEGEILLWALLDGLLEIPATVTQTQAETALANLVLELNLFSPNSKPPIATIKLQAVYDALERELCPSRTRRNGKHSHPQKRLQTLLQPLFSVLGPALYAWQNFLQRCLGFCEQSQITQAEFRTELCPYPAFSAELPLRKIAKQQLQNSFLHPLMFETDPSAAPYYSLPAAVLMGTIYEPVLSTASGSRIWPFVAALHKYQLAPVVYLSRYLVDIQVLEQRQKAQVLAHENAKEKLRLQNNHEKLKQAQEHEKRLAQFQQERISEYERVKKSLDQIKGLFGQQQMLWDEVEREIQPSEVFHYGIHSVRILNEGFNPDKQSEWGIRGFHRPGQLDQPELLKSFLYFLATGKLVNPDDDFPSKEELPQPKTLLAELYQYSDWAAQNLAYARSLFSWLKSVTYDANILESEAGTLRLTQLMQALWLLQPTLAQAHIPLFIWSSSLSTEILNLHRWLQDSHFLNKLFQNPELQIQLSGYDWSHVQTDSKHFLPAFALAKGQRPIVLLTALQRLVKDHLCSQTSNYLKLIRIQALVSDRPNQTGLYLECICEGTLTESGLTNIESNIQSEEPRDFSALLQKLSLCLGSPFSKQAHHRFDSRAAWLQAETRQGFFIETFPLVEANSEHETRIVIALGQVATLKHSLNSLLDKNVNQVEEEV